MRLRIYLCNFLIRHPILIRRSRFFAFFVMSVYTGCSVWKSLKAYDCDSRTVNFWPKKFFKIIILRQSCKSFFHFKIWIIRIAILGVRIGGVVKQENYFKCLTFAWSVNFHERQFSLFFMILSQKLAHFWSISSEITKITVIRISQFIWFRKC